MKLVSIIVPIYKVEKTIQRCLESIMGQTYRNLQVICIDDESPDNSRFIVEKLMTKDERITLVCQKNMGLSGARNQGIKLAEGDFILFVDSDDFIEKNMVERLVEIILQTDDDLVCCGTNVIYESFISLVKSDENYFGISNQVNVHVCPYHFLKLNVHAWNKLFRTEVIKDNQIEFPLGLYYEDAPFLWVYLFHSKKISLVSDKLYNYVRHEQSIMGSTYKKKNKRAMDHIFILYPVWTYIQKHKVPKKFQLVTLENSLKYVYIAFKNLPAYYRFNAFFEMFKLVHYVASLDNFYIKRFKTLGIYRFWFTLAIKKIFKVNKNIEEF